MAIGKWIGGVLGWIVSGGNMLGAFVGYFIGSAIESAVGNSNAGGSAGINDNAGYDEGERNSFLFSMMVLASYIIKADGKIMHSEMEYVRGFLRQNFGEAAAIQGNEILLGLFEKQKSEGPALYRENIRKVCVEIRFHMNESMRLQLLHFLVMIAMADGTVTADERASLYEVALTMGLSQSDVESIIAMGGYNGGGGYGGGYDGGSQRSAASAQQELDQAYKVLGIAPTATDEEVRTAYRQLALKHHPDRVASLGEDVRKAAEKKFQEINNAKETIYKARGL